MLAAPREAGTPEAHAARDAVARHLSALGYAVTLEPIRFTPSSLWALPVLGAGLGWLGLVLLPLLVMPTVTPWAALVLWAIGAVSLTALVWVVGAGWASLPLAGRLRDDATIVATRSPEVRRWIVAHLDSKAQGHSMAGRIVAVWLVLLAALALTALAALRVRGELPIVVAGAGAALAVLAGALAGRGRLKGRSVGARDNASGLFAALTVAEHSTDDATGFLITAAEEFGLVGARAFARAHAAALRGCEVINFDTLDDTGPLAVVRHDARGAPLAAATAGRLGGLGLPVRVRRLPLGILVDSMPLARAGAAAVTVARLDRSTLRLIHTPRDAADGFAFDTAERVGRALGA
ncbi:MAG TPA: M28 family peptidase [Gemmatimonadales bacterium]|nr:M28 family peptidase [Gemmatimonadales bacterium]